MNAHDEEFARQLRRTFDIEAEEHLQAIATGLLALEKGPPAAEHEFIVERIYREAHSLKGAARAVDMGDIESICQAMEAVYAGWKQLTGMPPLESLDVLHKSVDSIRGLLQGAGIAPENRSFAHKTLLRNLALLATPASASTGATEERVAAATPARREETESAAEKTVRIAMTKLDAQLSRVENLLPLKSVLALRANELRAISISLEQWQLRWHKVATEARAVYSPRAQPEMFPAAIAEKSNELGEFLEWSAVFHRSMQQKLLSLAAATGRDGHGFGKRLDELLEDSKKLLMLQFSTIGAAFPKMIRDLCREQGKQADLIIQGGDVEIDNRILEEMKDALVHLLRNNVDHGIESPEERTRRRKPPRGTISIAVSQINGSKVQIVVSDDGGGVDVEALKAAAVRRGVISAADASVLSDADALPLVFASEVSTSSSATTVSGCGLGMAIVKSKVERLGGQISLESTRHVGTTLRILLPLTVASFRGVLVEVAERAFVIPTMDVERIQRIRSGDIQTVENRDTLKVSDGILPLVHLEAVLGLTSAAHHSAAPPFISVVIVRASGARIAFIVDDVMHEEEVLVKPLRKPLIRVPNIGGTTILASGQIVPVLNASDLIKSSRALSSPPVRPSSTTIPAQAKRVLIVEDSITSRMLLKGILESAGYRVQAAVDGLDAFTKLGEGEFDVVVSDVEMPRLNGFDLTARVRADKRLAKMPVVLVTALESAVQRARGIEVGANAYIVKSSFDQNTLLEAVRRLT